MDIIFQHSSGRRIYRRISVPIIYNPPRIIRQPKWRPGYWMYREDTDPAFIANPYLWLVERSPAVCLRLERALPPDHLREAVPVAVIDGHFINPSTRHWVWLEGGGPFSLRLMHDGIPVRQEQHTHLSDTLLAMRAMLDGQA